MEEKATISCLETIPEDFNLQGAWGIREVDVQGNEILYEPIGEFTYIGSPVGLMQHRYWVEKEPFGDSESSYGQVFLAYDRRRQEVCCVKKARTGKTINREESIANARVGRHQNIVQVYDYIPLRDSDNDGLIIMELVEGAETLEDYLAGLKEEEIIKATRVCFEQIADAVNYMYKQGLVHQDLRVDRNVLVDKNGVVKIVDFGWTREANPEEIEALLKRIFTYFYGTMTKVPVVRKMSFEELDEKLGVNEIIEKKVNT